MVPDMPSQPELERLYDEHAQALFAFLLNLTHSEAETRDALQEVFCRLARRPELLAGARDERAFLLRLAHNLAVDRLRQRATRERTAETLAAESSGLFVPAEDPDQRTFQQQLGEALSTLPPEQRAVVHLKLWEGLTFDAIAGALGIPPNTAASRYRYGLDKMRSRLRPLYDEIK